MRTRPLRSSLLSLATRAVFAAALAGCAADEGPTVAAAAPEAARAAPADRETAARRWIALTRSVLGRREPGPLGTARTFALVGVAQYDAVIAAGDAKGRGTHPSEAGAAAGAAAAVLRALYPAEQAVVAAQLATDAAYFPALPSERDADFAAGVAVGERVAAAVLAHAATDGSQAVWTGAIPVGPGFWRNAPPPAQPLAPLWGRVRPWSLASGDQFRPAPPPAYGSPEFLAALAEVRGFTDGRTPAQLQVAQFWQSGSGPGGPMGHFGAVATRLAEEHHLGERASTRIFALLYMAMMDASIGCWDAKYAYWYVRPHQADPLVTTPVGRPNFPSYPSAHSCLSAAAAGVLGDAFPSASRDLLAQVEEAGVARLYAGLHFRFDVDAGRALGFAVARATLEQAPRGHRPIPLD
jgi:membrane-associated phospholipid phosphatase